MTELQSVGHDREASTKGTFKRAIREFKEDGLTDWAAALTYYGVLALFPALLALVSLVGIFGDPTTTTQNVMRIVSQVAPGAATEALAGPIQGITSNPGASLITLIIGLVAALWSASGYVGGFMRASNVLYETVEARPIWKLRPLQMLVTLLMLILIVIAALAVVVTGPLAEAVGNVIGLGSTAVTVWSIAKWPVIVLFVITMISVLYYASPNAKLRGFKSVMPGAAFAVVVWLVASLLFGFYVANFGSYNETYGTLGGIIIFLVWLWITNVAILLGAEINAERERTAELAEGRTGAEREIGLEPRDEPADKERLRSE